MPKGDIAVVDEAECGEEHVTARFKEARDDTELSPDREQLVATAVARVKAGHDAGRELDRRTRAFDDCPAIAPTPPTPSSTLCVCHLARLPPPRCRTGGPLQDRLRERVHRDRVERARSRLTIPTTALIAAKLTARPASEQSDKRSAHLARSTASQPRARGWLSFGGRKMPGPSL